MKKREEIVMAAVVSRAGKKMLACAKAHKLAREHAISLKEIGKICNRNGIKILACQLGCF